MATDQINRGSLRPAVRGVRTKSISTFSVSEQTLVTGVSGARVCLFWFLIYNGGSVAHEYSLYFGTGNSTSSDSIRFGLPFNGAASVNLVGSEPEGDSGEGLFIDRLTSGSDKMIVTVGYLILKDSLS